LERDRSKGDPSQVAELRPCVGLGPKPDLVGAGERGVKSAQRFLVVARTFDGVAAHGHARRALAVAVADVGVLPLLAFAVGGDALRPPCPASIASAEALRRAASRFRYRSGLQRPWLDGPPRGDGVRMPLGF
jgi:hypothetical protein